MKFLRVAGSLKVGTIHTSTLVQALQPGGHPTALGRAIAELGRISKTLHFNVHANTISPFQKPLPRDTIARFDHSHPHPKSFSKLSSREP
jgi:hypothetical protein